MEIWGDAEGESSRELEVSRYPWPAANESAFRVVRYALPNFARPEFKGDLDGFGALAEDGVGQGRLIVRIFLANSRSIKMIHRTMTIWNEKRKHGGVSSASWAEVNRPLARTWYLGLYPFMSSKELQNHVHVWGSSVLKKEGLQRHGLLWIMPNTMLVFLDLS